MLLESRGWQRHECHELVPALAELCVLERTQTSRDVDGLARAEGIALLVVEPARWSQLDAMLSAVRRYLPGVAVWSYADGSLRALEPPAETVRSAPPPLEGADRRTEDGEGGPGRPERPTAAEARGGEPPRPQISAEEIAMLLDSDLGDSLT
ncbi:MAG: hypothetical protein ACYS0G_02310 [Planctomycetota bacterium]